MTLVFNKAVLKRFLKGLVAALLAAALTYAVSFLTNNPVVLGSLTPLAAAALLALEKSVPTNF